MDKTSTEVMKLVQKFNDNATQKDRWLLAMFIIYNVAVDATDNAFECKGLLDSIKEEVGKENSEFKNNIQHLINKN